MAHEVNAAITTIAPASERRTSETKVIMTQKSEVGEPGAKRGMGRGGRIDKRDEGHSHLTIWGSEDFQKYNTLMTHNQGKPKQPTKKSLRQAAASSSCVRPEAVAVAIDKNRIEYQMQLSDTNCSLYEVFEYELRSYL